MKLKAKYGRKHYKSDESFLNAVYQRNKKIINELLENVGKEGGVSTLRQFKNAIFETQKIFKRKGKTSTITKAMNTYTASAQFMQERFYELHFKENLERGFKKFGVFKTLYTLTGKKWDINKIKYIGDNSYSYRGYVISFSNSPEKISIYKRKSSKNPTEEVINPLYSRVL